MSGLQGFYGSIWGLFSVLEECIIIALGNIMLYVRERLSSMQSGQDFQYKKIHILAFQPIVRRAEVP